MSAKMKVPDWRYDTECPNCGLRGSFGYRDVFFRWRWRFMASYKLYHVNCGHCHAEIPIPGETLPRWVKASAQEYVSFHGGGCGL